MSDRDEHTASHHRTRIEPDEPAIISLAEHRNQRAIAEWQRRLERQEALAHEAMRRESRAWRHIFVIVYGVVLAVTVLVAVRACVA